MAIAPVSSVSFKGNLNQVNFEGKKKEKTSGLQMSNTLKAIPLATLIAMSPLTAKAQNDVELMRVTFPQAYAITNEPADIVFYDTNNDKETIEKVCLKSIEFIKTKTKYNGKDVPSCYVLTRDYEIKRLEVDEVTEQFKHRADRHSKRYYIRSDATFRTSAKHTDDAASNVIEAGQTKKQTNVRTQITPDLYNYLQSIFKDEIEYVVKKVVEDGDANELIEDIYGF